MGLRLTRFEPPYTEPYVRWCGGNGPARARSYPIMAIGPLWGRHLACPSEIYRQREAFDGISIHKEILLRTVVGRGLRERLS